LGDGWKKIDGDEVVCYWLEEAGNILVAGEFLKRAHGLNAIACHSYDGSVSIIELFQRIFLDRAPLEGQLETVRIVNNKQLGDRFFDTNITSALRAKMGLTLYDVGLPGQNFFNITSVEQLAAYTGNSRIANDWQLVISDAGNSFWDTRAFFHLRGMHELNNLL
jgi:hypothetical protein